MCALEKPRQAGGGADRIAQLRTSSGELAAFVESSAVALREICAEKKLMAGYAPQMSKEITEALIESDATNDTERVEVAARQLRKALSVFEKGSIDAEGIVEAYRARIVSRERMRRNRDHVASAAYDAAGAVALAFDMGPKNAKHIDDAACAALAEAVHAGVEDISDLRNIAYDAACDALASLGYGTDDIHAAFLTELDRSIAEHSHA